MKRIVYFGPKDVRFLQGDIPQCGQGELLVKVEAAAICGSDIKAYNVGNPKMVSGRTMGHEFVGTVQESRAAGFEKGDRVTMATTVGCGSCYYCKLGKSNLCTDSKAMGFYFDGAFADYLIIPQRAVQNGNVLKVDQTPAEVLALSEPMSCVLNDLSRVPVKEISSAVVIGLGALGMLHAIALREFGVKNIVCCDFPGAKKDKMNEVGFVTVTPDELDERYLELSDNLGFELVVITAPSNPVQADAPKYARKGGYVSYFASLPVDREKITISSRLLHYNELVFLGTSDSTVNHVRQAVKLMTAQQELIKSIITIMPMDKFMEGIEGVMDMRYAKVVLLP